LLLIVGVSLVVGAVMFAGAAGAAPRGAISPRCLPGQRSMGAQICVATGHRAAAIVATVRKLKRRYALNAIMFGAWRGRREVASGAVGAALPGVPATRAMYFRIGNTTESFETTLLMQLVDKGKIRLSDKLSKWYPRLPLANEVTVGMLASSMPVSQQIRKRILMPLKMRRTRMTTTAAVPAPTLHGYTDERGVWEDDTFWSPSWATYTGDMTSRLSDLKIWANAVGTGSLLSKRSHARQIAPKTVGLGGLTVKFFYGLGVAVANKWVLAGAPGLLGYTGIVAYLPTTRTTVVVFATAGPHSPPGTHYAGGIFDAVGRILAPGSPPTFPAG
jgi:CubicO group peptidase (beta-lactamase class C family)